MILGRTNISLYKKRGIAVGLSQLVKLNAINESVSKAFYTEILKRSLWQCILGFIFI